MGPTPSSLPCPGPELVLREVWMGEFKFSALISLPTVLMILSDNLYVEQRQEFEEGLPNNLN